jgi:hypothetical protein
MVIEIGSSRSGGVQAEHKRRYSGTEEDAHEDEVLAEQRSTGAHRDPLNPYARADLPDLLVTPHRKKPTADAAPTIIQMVSGSGGSSPSAPPAPGARLQRAEHDDAQPRPT